MRARILIQLSLATVAAMLSLYFWLRLGYKPVALEAGGGRHVWMERWEVAANVSSK